MKIRIELIEENADGGEEEVIIRCRKIDETVQKIQQYVLEQSSGSPRIAFFKDQEEYYFPLDDVLFFETVSDKVYAYTADDAYMIRYRLYELENMLPHAFVRSSKSSILNTKNIYSIQKSLPSSSLVRFRDSHRQVYVSRSYYKQLKQRLEESYYE